MSELEGDESLVWSAGRLQDASIIAKRTTESAASTLRQTEALVFGFMEKKALKISPDPGFWNGSLGLSKCTLGTPC